MMNPRARGRAGARARAYECPRDQQCSVLALLQGRRGGTRARRRRGRREEGGGRREARGERGEGSSENEKGEGEREGEGGGGRREGLLRFPENPLRKVPRSTRGAPPNQSIARCIAQSQSVSACVCGNCGEGARDCHANCSGILTRHHQGICDGHVCCAGLECDH